MRPLFSVLRFLHWEWPCTCRADPYCVCSGGLKLPRVTPRYLRASCSPLPVVIARRIGRTCFRPAIMDAGTVAFQSTRDLRTAGHLEDVK